MTEPIGGEEWHAHDGLGAHPKSQHHSDPAVQPDAVAALAEALLDTDWVTQEQQSKNHDATVGAQEIIDVFAQTGWHLTHSDATQEVERLRAIAVRIRDSYRAGYRINADQFRELDLAVHALAVDQQGRDEP